MFPPAAAAELPGAVAAEVVKSEPRLTPRPSAPEGTCFILLDRGRTSGFKPAVPVSEEPDLVTYNILTYRQYKLRCRRYAEAASWAGRELRITLIYHQDGLPVLNGTGSKSRGGGDADDFPLVLFSGGGPSKFARVASIVLRLDKRGTTFDAFGVAASSHRHGGRRFELRVEAAPGAPPLSGRIVFLTRTHPGPARRPAGPASESEGEEADGGEGGSKRPRSRADSWREQNSIASSSEGESEGEAKRRPRSSQRFGRDQRAPLAPAEDAEREIFLDAKDAPSSDGGTPRPTLGALGGGVGGGGGEPFQAHEVLDMIEGVLANFHIGDKKEPVFTRPQLQEGDIDLPPGAVPRGPRPEAPGALFWMTAEEAQAQADPLRAPAPPLSLPAAEDEALWAAFCRLREPASLASRANARGLVRLLLDPRTLASRLYGTADGRYALRRAFHNLREAGAYPAVGVIVESAVSAVCSLPTALPDREAAGAAVDMAANLLLACTSETLLCSPDLAYISWQAAKRVLGYADAAAGAWRAGDVALHSAVLHRRAVAFFHHGFTDAAIDTAFEAWSALIRAQAIPSRLEARLLHALFEMHLYAGRAREARRLAERLYYFPGPAPEDVFLEAQVHHALALVEGALRQRPKSAIALATRAIAAYEGLPFEGYRHYVTRIYGYRAALTFLSGKLRTGGQMYRAMLRQLSGTHEAWSSSWCGGAAGPGEIRAADCACAPRDTMFMLRYSWLHPPEVARELEGIALPPSQALRFMTLHVAWLPLLDRPLATPILGHVLYQRGLALLLCGMAAKAAESLERARAFLAGRLPRHFPPDSPRMRSIQALLREARRRPGAAGAPSPDLFGFAARRMSPAAALAAPSALPAELAAPDGGDPASPPGPLEAGGSPGSPSTPRLEHGCVLS